MKRNRYLIIAILIISVSINVLWVLYYLLLIRPKINSQINTIKQLKSIEIDKDEIFTKTLTCQSEGDRYVKNDNNPSQSNFSQLTHHTVYSPKYNACILLYRTVLTSNTERTTFNQIINLNTRKDIYYYTYTYQKSPPRTRTIDLGNEDEYNQIVSEIFGIVE